MAIGPGRLARSDYAGRTRPGMSTRMPINPRPNLSAAGGIGRASPEFADLLNRNPDDVQALTWRGRVYGYRRQYELAIHSLDEAVYLEPKNPQTYLARAEIRTRQYNLRGAARHRRSAAPGPDKPHGLSPAGRSAGQTKEMESGAERRSKKGWHWSPTTRRSIFPGPAATKQKGHRFGRGRSPASRRDRCNCRTGTGRRQCSGRESPRRSRRRKSAGQARLAPAKG